ncbi:mevalonate kinase-like isoform X2 [Dysidea avara]
MATSLDVRTYVMMGRSHDADIISLELVDLEFQFSWSRNDLAPFLEAYRPLFSAGGPAAADKDVQEKMSEDIVRMAGVEVGTVLGDLKVLAARSFLHLLLAICGDYLKTCGGLQFVMTSQLPMGAGLGSSAAFAVTFAGAMLSATGKLNSTIKPTNKHEIPERLRARITGSSQDCPSFCDWTSSDLDLINKWAFTVEEIIHGTPSGIDNSISCYGGTIMLRSSKMEHLDSMAKLDILLINTGVPRSSKKLITAVRTKHDKYPEVMNHILDAVEGITLHCRDQLHQLLPLQQSNSSDGIGEIYDQLEDMVSMNQQLLDLMGVGHESLTRVCHICRSHELSCKLTGAGGGGCAFAVIRPGYSQQKLTGLMAELEQAGYKCWQTSIGTSGVTQHCTT